LLIGLFKVKDGRLGHPDSETAVHMQLVASFGGHHESIIGGRTTLLVITVARVARRRSRQGREGRSEKAVDGIADPLNLRHRRTEVVRWTRWT
jgi:hypothetical protein